MRKELKISNNMKSKYVRKAHRIKMKKRKRKQREIENPESEKTD